MSEQRSEIRRGRELRAATERDIPATLDLWPAIRRRVNAQARASRRRAAPRWRPFAPVLAAGLLVCALLGAALLRPEQVAPVGAAAIIGQARAAGQAAPPSYHLTATFSNATDGLVWRTEHWQAADGRFASVSTGTATVQGLIDTGGATWFWLTEAGQTRVEYHPQSKAQARGGPVETPSLEEWLGAGGSDNCTTTRREADDTVAGRAVYVISMVATGTCGERDVQPGRSVVLLDQATFLLLGTAFYDEAGTLREQYAVTAITYGDLPESTFAYTPPAGAIVCASTATPGFASCQETGGARPRASQGPTLDGSVARAVTDAQLTLLGVTPQEYKRAIGDGQPLADIAQGRGINPAQLRAAMQTAGQGRIDALLAEGALTTEQATAQHTLLAQWIAEQFGENTTEPVAR